MDRAWENRGDASSVIAVGSTTEIALDTSLETTDNRLALRQGGDACTSTGPRACRSSGSPRPTSRSSDRLPARLHEDIQRRVHHRLDAGRYRRQDQAHAVR